MNENKTGCLIGCIILLSIIFISLPMYYGTIDDYAPKHVAPALKTISDAKLDFEINEYGYLISAIPAYYTFIAEVLLLLGLPYETLVLYPIILIPYLVTCFGFFFVLSHRNWIISSLITLLYVTSGVTGSHKIFLWPHGLGELILFSFLIILFKSIKENRRNINYSMVMILLIISVMYVSYNVAYVLIAIVLSAILEKQFKLIKDQNITYTNLFLIGMVFYFGFSYFVYRSFIPHIKYLMDQLKQGTYISFADKLFKNYFGLHSKTDFDAFFVEYPKILSYVYLVKYILIFLGIAVLVWFVSRELKKKKYKPEYILFVNVFLGVSFYMVLRLFLGQIAITELMMPFLVGLTILNMYFRGKQKTKLTCAVILFMIAGNFFSIFVMNKNGFVQRDKHLYKYIGSGFLWLDANLPQQSIVVSDQLTYGWFFTHNTYLRYCNHRPANVLYVREFSNDDYKAIWLKEPIKNVRNRYLVLNYGLPYIQTSGWKYFKSFTVKGDEINNRFDMIKIYAVSGKLAVYL